MNRALPFLIAVMMPTLGLAQETSSPAPAQAPQQRDESNPHARSIEHWMAHLQKQNPDEFARLERLRNEDPEKFRVEMRKRLEEVWQNWRSRNPDGEPTQAGEPGRMSPPPRERTMGQTGMSALPPEIVAIEQKLRGIAEKYRDSKDKTEKAELEKRAIELADKVFAYRAAERQRHVEMLEAELKKLRAAVEREMEHRDETVRHRVKAILSGASGRSERPVKDAPPKDSAPKGN